MARVTVVFTGGTISMGFDPVAGGNVPELDGSRSPGRRRARDTCRHPGGPRFSLSAGAVGTAYAFPGGGATWVRAGAIPAGTLCAIKARVALAYGVGAGMGRHELTALLTDPLP